MFQYTYTLLRYVHDTVTGEFINVGVALFSPEAEFVSARCKRTYSRASRLFPGLDGEVFKTSIRFVEDKFKDKSPNLFDPVSPTKTVMGIANWVLPNDDSSLQWSPFGSGITKDPQKTLDQLFERMVERYDERPQHDHRTDEEVWRRFHKDLQQRNIDIEFKPKVIVVSDDKIEFKHAWKNGIWHCVEPLSFDLSSPETIREKAHKWLGHMTSVRTADEAFKVYFLVGAPQKPELFPAYQNAVQILEKSPVKKQIYQEASDLENLTNAIEDEVRAHSPRL